MTVELRVEHLGRLRLLKRRLLQDQKYWWEYAEPVFWWVVVRGYSRCVEWGVREGYSAAIIALATEINGGQLLCFDSLRQHKWLPNNALFHEVRFEESGRVINGAWPQGIDFIHHDTDPHTKEQTVDALDLAGQLVRAGGSVALHDAARGYGGYGVREGIQEWLKRQQNWRLVADLNLSETGMAILERAL